MGKFIEIIGLILGVIGLIWLLALLIKHKPKKNAVYIIITGIVIFAMGYVTPSSGHTEKLNFNFASSPSQKKKDAQKKKNSAKSDKKSSTADSKNNSSSTDDNGNSSNKANNGQSSPDDKESSAVPENSDDKNDNSKTDDANKNKNTDSPNGEVSATNDPESSGDPAPEENEKPQYTKKGKWYVAPHGMTFVDDDKYYTKVTNPKDYEYVYTSMATEDGASKAKSGNKNAMP